MGMTDATLEKRDGACPKGILLFEPYPSPHWSIRHGVPCQVFPRDYRYLSQRQDDLLYSFLLSVSCSCIALFPKLCLRHASVLHRPTWGLNGHLEMSQQLLFCAVFLDLIFRWRYYFWALSNALEENPYTSVFPWCHPRPSSRRFLHHYKLVTVALRWVNFICTWWINSIDYQQFGMANYENRLFHDKFTSFFREMRT